MARPSGAQCWHWYLVPPHLALDIRDGDRGPTFHDPAGIGGRGRVDRAGHFAKRGPIQACRGLGTHWKNSRRLPGR